MGGDGVGGLIEWIYVIDLEVVINWWCECLFLLDGFSVVVEVCVLVEFYVLLVFSGVIDIDVVLFGVEVFDVWFVWYVMIFDLFCIVICFMV